MAESRGGLPNLSRVGWLLVGLAPLPLLAAWAFYARSAGLGADAIRLPLIAVIVWGVACGFLSWRKLDEGGREAIKVAWCWGAGPGMMVAATVLLLVMSYPTPLGDALQQAVTRFVEARGADQPGASAFFLGAFFVIAIQQMLFVIVWVVWWARRNFGL